MEEINERNYRYVRHFESTEKMLKYVDFQRDENCLIFQYDKVKLIAWIITDPATYNELMMEEVAE